MTNSTPSPGAGDATVAEEKKYDESKPSARLLLISGLFFVGRDTGLLGIEALRTSTVAMLYAAALSTALLATLMFLWRESRKAPTPSEPTPVSDPFWDQPRQFTDPWYQVPALFCVTVLGWQFALDLIAEPPATVRAAWFLVSLGATTVAMGLGLIHRSDTKKNVEGNGPEKPRELESHLETTLHDPWFSILATTLYFLHFARSGLELIEEEPESVMATVYILMPLVMLTIGNVTTAVSRFRRKRKEMATATDAGAVGVTGDGG